MIANAIGKVLDVNLDKHMTIKAAIFDCDGTLLDSEKIYMSTWNMIGKQMGYEIPLEVLRDTRGKDGSYGRKRILGVMGEDFPIDEVNKKRAVLNEELFYATENIVKPGVENFLQWLKEHDIRTGVGSAKSYKITSEHLKHAGIYECIDVVMGGDMVTHNKPNPELFLTIAEKLGVASEECIVFGDAHSDMMAAKAAGMQAVFVPDLVPVDEKIETYADYIIDQIDKIIPILEGK